MMYLSYEEIMNLINKEKDKHKELLESNSPQTNKSYSRDAIFVMRGFEREVRKHFAKKYR